jgi:hypothetical protein
MTGTGKNKEEEATEERRSIQLHPGDRCRSDAGYS